MLDIQVLSEVGTQLRGALQGALESMPNGFQRPQEMAKTLRLNKNLTSRVCAAIRSQDPLATMSLVPGPVPLRQLLRAASANGADKSRVTIAHEAIEQFEAVIRDEFDDRAGLDAVLGTMVPETRRRHELAAKQAVFRGMEAIKGVSTDVAAVTFLAHPSAADPERADAVMVGGLFGLRRIRPGSSIQFTAQQSQTLGPDSTRLPLPGGGTDGGPLLREFCRPENLDVSRTTRGQYVRFDVGGTRIGRSSAMDIVLSEYYPRIYSRFEPKPGRIRHFSATVEQPSKLFIFDVLVHESLWPGAAFEIHAFDTTVRGMADPNDHEQVQNEIRLVENVQTIGTGINGLRSSKLPGYVELLTHVAGRMSWNADKFRAFRCQISYPVYGSQICLFYRSGAPVARPNE
jgi:hypothetical protein